MNYYNKNLFNRLVGVAEYPIYGFLIIIYPFLFIKYGIDYTDAPWHYRAYLTGEEHSQFTYLSYVTGGWIAQILGESIVTFRFAARALEIISATLVVWGILGSKQNIKIKLQVLSFATVGITAISPNILHFDVFSSFFLSLIILFGYYYIESNKSSFLVIIAVLTALISSMRLPGILVLLVVSLMIIGKNYFSKTNLKGFVEIFSYLVITIVTYILLDLIFNSSSPSETVSSQDKNSSSVLRSIINMLTYSEGSHNLKLLITKYAKDIVAITDKLGVLVLLTFVYNYLKKASENLPKIVHYTLILFLYIFLCFNLFSNIINDAYNNALSLFLIAFGFYLAGIILYNSVVKKEKKIIVFIIFALITSFVAAFGSDTGLKKAARVLVYVIPICMVLFYNIIDIKYRKVFYLLLMTVTLLLISNKVLIGKTYEDDSIRTLKYSVNHPLLESLQTTQMRKDNIEEILLITDSLAKSGNKYVFYGTTSHLFSYLSKTAKPGVATFKMQFENKKQADLLEKYILREVEKPAVILLFGYPESKNEKNGGEIEEKLYALSYSLEKDGVNYKVFTP